MNSDHRIAVQIAHDDQLFAAGLRAILAADPQIDVIEASSAYGDVVHPFDGGVHVDVVLADYEQALHLARRARGAAAHGGREPRVMVFTCRGSEWEIHSALQAGVQGYLLQGCTADDAVSGVKSLARGGSYFCSMASQRMVDCITHETLTGRESEVLRLLSDGLSNKLIARELNVAVGTVKAHLRAILAKLGASSRTHAVLVAARRGLVMRQTAVSDSAGAGAWPRPRLVKPAPANVDAVRYA